MNQPKRETPGFSLWRDHKRNTLVRFTMDGPVEVPISCPKCGAAGEEHHYDCFPRVG